MRIPEGWEMCKSKEGVPNPYAIQRDEWTVCRIGGANGWTYELWHGKEQVAVNLPNAQAAIDLVPRLSTGEAA
jgi:hypothetical protein